MTWQDTGHEQVLEEITGATLNNLATRTGIYGLSYIAQRVLDEHYPEDIFLWREVQYGVNWAGEQGEDISPGVKWVALMRMAIEELNKLEPKP